MKTSVWLGLLALLGLVGGAAQAGALYGTLRQDGRPLGDARVEVGCPTLAAPRARTEAVSDASSGGFSLRLAASGRCEMRLRHGARLGPTFVVFVSESPARLDVTVNSSLVRVP